MKDFSKLYQLQDKVLLFIKELGLPVYLTGGTALGRFYLDHRYCENLYFNIDDGNRYLQYISILKKGLENTCQLDLNKSYFSEDFTRIFLLEQGMTLKIELIRNIKRHEGRLSAYKFGMIDLPEYILPKKLRAITWRNDLEDFFDLVQMARNYSFKWSEFYFSVTHGANVRPEDIKKQLLTYPVESIVHVEWLKNPIDMASFKLDLSKIASDFVAGADNSLGLNNLSINLAQPLS